jgi:flavin reductase (DIM6/NTAB) family NADH-FMN oxidoreductase RutF
MADAEKAVKRNPHPDFKKVENSRPEWSHSSQWHFTKTVAPNWSFGEGANDKSSNSKKHIAINPYEPGRPATFNYKLLISAIVPRPIGFCSTVSKEGKTNIAPFSYFNVVNHDPPLFIFGFSGGFDRAKDTLRNLVETKECCVNIISEHFIEAANACSINAPHGVSEWDLTGLTPKRCDVVKAPRVGEAVFSVEAKLHSTEEFESRGTPGKKTGVLAIVEGLRFWVREDAINEEKNLVDPGVLRPMSRLGGITYGRVVEGIEILRPDWRKENEDGKLEPLLAKERDGQAQL